MGRPDWLDDADWLQDEDTWQQLVDDTDADTDIAAQSGPSTPPVDRRDEDRGPRVPELAVVERDLPGNLFGFTRPGSGHVNVNSNLYKVDKQRTIAHEKTHHRHPKDELTIRYINGDIDVKNTLSFQANNASRIGNGSSLFNAIQGAAYGTDDAYRRTGTTQDYAAPYQ